MPKRNIIVLFLVVFTVLLSSFSFYTYQIIYTPNILVEAEEHYITIPHGGTFQELQQLLGEEYIATDLVSFSFLAKLKDLDTQLKPGRYLLTPDMTNMELINLLRSGRQTPVNLTFSNARLLSQVPKKLVQNLEIDSAQMATLMLSDTTPGHFGFEPHTFISMFIPNTYQVYWTATPKEILDRLKREYDNFWTEERLQKAKNLGMTKEEVSTLASIVQSETNDMAEAPKVAGLYINRLQRGYKLQADPTLKFALGDFSIRRVLNRHKEIESPYNTYKYYGLPPGPICMPSIAAVESVLNYEEHNYLYMCASADFSGKHIFAKSLREHNINAAKLHRALNKRKIYR